MDLTVIGVKNLVNQLKNDPSFRRMAKGIADSEEIDRWNRWIEESEENRESVRKALAEIAGFEFKEPPLPDIELQWEQLYQSTVGRRNRRQRDTKSLKKRGVPTWLYRVAAILLVVTTTALGLYISTIFEEEGADLEEITRQKTVNTGEKEQKILDFSNGARIVLNSNSSLTYSRNVTQQTTIEAHLDGEAYFETTSHTSLEVPTFKVVTPSGMIEDIGTKFLVSVNEKKSRVVLQEGNVRIQTRDNTVGETKFYMNEGEMVEFSEERILKKNFVNSTFYTSWATGVMRFDETPLSKFADYVEERFDVKVKFEKAEYRNITVDGAIYFNSLSELVNAMSDVVKIPVYKSKDGRIVHFGNPEKN